MSYENTPLKIQWREIDGIMTPFVLPQVWSHEKQDWVVTSEEDPLPTRLTGSNVELIKEHNYETSGTNNAFFGSDTSTSAASYDDLDVSKYKNVIIYLKNETDRELTLESCYARIKNKEREFERILRFGIDIPAGAETVVGSFEHEDIDNTKYLKKISFPFLRVRTFNQNGLGEGRIKVTFMGVRA